MIALDKAWLAIYTKPRCEKKVSLLLENKGITTYCPLVTVLKQWSDRKKIVEEPLFKSYVFVYIDITQYTQVRAVPGVVNFVYWLGKPANIPQAEVDIIKRFLNEYENVESFANLSEQVNLGDRVSVDSGIFMHKEGIVIKEDNNYVTVKLESIGFTLKAKIKKSSLQLVKRAPKKLNP